MRSWVFVGLMLAALAGEAAADQSASFETGLQAGITPKGFVSQGAYVGYGPLALGAYTGGERSGGRRSGYGADLRLNVGDVFGPAVPVGNGFLSLYGEAGVNHQLGDGNTSGASFAAGGGGMYFRSQLPKAALRFGLGYHTAKGVNLSCGVSW